ncbi:hypothetical protein [Rhizohabitans arisaemae]|uniref:hypothetical protein n=1 Tax=Rhizohabitans arisaemae TaxID=2720610 RepID=UPI0024B22E33|nr:hypothetical protein [Rhizohabitans arisaemae]
MGPDELERHITELRARVWQARARGEESVVRALREEIHQAERTWEAAFEPGRRERPPPAREQVHRALTLLGVPAATRLIAAVGESFFAGGVGTGRLAGLRRDEERAYRAAPGARPYYLCAALTAQPLSPARGVLAVSTWPMPVRIVGPLSPRTDFLVSTIRIAEHVMGLAEAGTDASEAAYRLLTRMGHNIPGGVGGFERVDPVRITAAAEAELAVHRDRDRLQRAEAAERAVARLDEAGRLFGARGGTVKSEGTA